MNNINVYKVNHNFKDFKNITYSLDIWHVHLLLFERPISQLSMPSLHSSDWSINSCKSQSFIFAYSSSFFNIFLLITDKITCSIQNIGKKCFTKLICSIIVCQFLFRLNTCRIMSSVYQFSLKTVLLSFLFLLNTCGIMSSVYQFSLKTVIIISLPS